MSKNDSKFKILLKLFISFFKIGLFTFGGGYAMIPLIQKEAVEKRNWCNNEEILDIISIAESTPGPIAVNSATYIGYKVSGFFGSLFATLGLALPSFVIIYLISIFYDKFINIEFISHIFSGLKIGVIVLLLTSVFKLSKTMKLNKISYIVFGISLVIFIGLSIFNITIPNMTIIFILVGFLYGIISELLVKKESNK